LVVLLIVFSAVFVASLRKGAQRQLIRELSSVALVVLLFTASQALVYSKSGIYERYLVPGTMALAFLIIFLISKVDSLLGRQRLRLAISALLVIGTHLALAMQTGCAGAAAKVYAQEGVTFNQALKEVDSSTGKDDVIVLL